MLHLRAVHLAVGDLDRSIRFYGGVLGMTVLHRGEQVAELGAGTDGPTLLHLTRLADPTPRPARSAGLFHVAWRHPDRSALAATLHRVTGAHYPLTGVSDHGVSEALYLDDPDGLGVELYADRPREDWPALTNPGERVHMFTAPLDLRDLSAQAGGPGDGLAVGTDVGHVHLQVSDLERSTAWYSGELGLELMADWAGAAFFAADGYHHHFGINTWQSAGAPRTPGTAPDIRLIELSWPERPGGPALLRDPDGIGLEVR